MSPGRSPLRDVLAAWARRLVRAGADGRRAPADDRSARARESFVAATFATLGRVVHADGPAAQAERVAARAIARLDLPAGLRARARELFALGASPTHPLEQVIEQFADECRDRRDLARLFVEIQVEAACADGPMRGEARALVERLCARLGITASERARMESAATGLAAGERSPAAGDPALAAAHAVLGVPVDADDATLRQAYRRLIGQHHPDRLVAQGLPEEMVRTATRRTQEIKAAYERARAARGG